MLSFSKHFLRKKFTEAGTYQCIYIFAIANENVAWSATLAADLHLVDKILKFNRYAHLNPVCY